jgi:hypothetical protein
VQSHGVAILGESQLEALFDESGVVARSPAGELTVDIAALAELRRELDQRLALTNGLFALGSLSRNSVPPRLRWTRRPAHELFERSFFLTVTSSFQRRGLSWGTQKRGRAIPDGMLEIPTVRSPLLYDCKASRKGYEMSFRDLLAFAHYVRNPPVDLWQPGPKQHLGHFLVVSSGFIEGKRGQAFSRRESQLEREVPGSNLVWLRAPDLARFAISLEANAVAPAHREEIAWHEIFAHGNVRWEHFEDQLRSLRERFGYMFEGL